MLNSSVYYRGSVVKHIKYKDTEDAAKHLVKHKKEKEYEYYICDHCGKEIEIKKEKYKMSGGIVVIPESISKRKDFELALCNKCLNPVLKELERKET